MRSSPCCRLKSASGKSAAALRARVQPSACVSSSGRFGAIYCTSTLTYETVTAPCEQRWSLSLQHVTCETTKCSICSIRCYRAWVKCLFSVAIYLSLRLAAFVISFAYHAIEGVGTVRRGKRTNLVGCQVWYADDGYLLGNSKKALKRAVMLIARVLAGFGLELKPWKIMHNGVEPIDFAGYRIWAKHVDLRKRLWKRLRRAFFRFDKRRTPRLARRVCSYFGWMKTAEMEEQLVVRQRVFNAARAAS